MDSQGHYVLKILYVKTKEFGPLGGMHWACPPRSAKGGYECTPLSMSLCLLFISDNYQETLTICCCLCCLSNILHITRGQPILCTEWSPHQVELQLQILGESNCSHCRQSSTSDPGWGSLTAVEVCSLQWLQSDTPNPSRMWSWTLSAVTAVGPPRMWS